MGEGGGYYSSVKVTGMIKGFLGLKFSILGIFSGGKIGQVF